MYASMRTCKYLVSRPRNNLTLDESILDARGPRKAKGDAGPSPSHFAAAVRQKNLAPQGLASFGAEPHRRNAHRPAGSARAPAVPLCIRYRPIQCKAISGTGH